MDKEPFNPSNSLEQLSSSSLAITQEDDLTLSTSENEKQDSFQESDGHTDKTAPKTVYKICVIGSPGVGKTSLISRFVDVADPARSTRNSFIPIDDLNDNGLNNSGSPSGATWPTKSKKFIYHKYRNHEDCILEIFDCPSDHEPVYMENKKKWFTWADGFILCFDICSIPSYESLLSYHKHIAETKRQTSNGPLKLSIVLVGTHADKESRRKVSRMLASDLAKRFTCPYLEVSIRVGEKVDQVFHVVLKEIASNLNTQTNSDSDASQPLFAVPNMVRRSSSADTRKPSSSSPILKRRLSGEISSRELGRALLLEKNWELYRKDIPDLMSKSAEVSVPVKRENKLLNISEETLTGISRSRALSSESVVENFNVQPKTPKGDTHDLPSFEVPTKKGNSLKATRFQSKEKKKASTLRSLAGMVGSALGKQKEKVENKEDSEEFEFLKEQMSKDEWNNKEYVPRDWKQLTQDHPTDAVPSYLNTLINEDCKSSGYLLELGTTSVNYDLNNNDSPKIEIEEIVDDIPYFEKYLLGNDHFHLIATGEESKTVGPIIITSESPSKEAIVDQHKKVIMRTKKGNKRFLIPWTYANSNTNMIKYIKGIYPQLAPIKFTEILHDSQLDDDLVKYEKQEIIRRYKFGVLYVKDGQTDENEIFSNVDSSSDYEEFLEMLGEKVALEGFDKFRGGLDVKSNSTGTHSVYTTVKDREVMFHVATLLPYHENDEQKIERKRHLGNDIVVVIFKDGDKPFDPRILVSHFNHIFCIVQVAKKEEDKVFYKVGFANKPGVPPFGPFLSYPPIFEKSVLKELLLTKLINAERAAMHSHEFKDKMERTRKTLLADLVNSYIKKSPKRKQTEKTPYDSSLGSLSIFTTTEEDEKLKIEKKNLSSAMAFREKLRDLGAKLQERTQESDPKKFDSLDFLIQLTHVIQYINGHCTFGAIEKRQPIVDEAQDLLGQGSHLAYAQEMRKRDHSIESFEEIQNRVLNTLQVIQQSTDKVVAAIESDYETLKEKKRKLEEDRKKEKEKRKLHKEEEDRKRKEQKRQEEKRREDEKKKAKEDESRKQDDSKKKVEEEKKKQIEEQKKKLEALEQEMALSQVITDILAQGQKEDLQSTQESAPLIPPVIIISRDRTESDPLILLSEGSNSEGSYRRDSVAYREEEPKQQSFSPEPPRKPKPPPPKREAPKKSLPEPPKRGDSASNSNYGSDYSANSSGTVTPNTMEIQLSSDSVVNVASSVNWKVLLDLIKSAEEVGKNLQELLDKADIDINELRNSLRSLGQQSKSAYEIIGKSFKQNQITQLTQNTQKMLQIGLEFKNNISNATQEKRKELLAAATGIIDTMKAGASILDSSSQQQ